MRPAISLKDPASWPNSSPPGTSTRADQSRMAKRRVPPINVSSGTMVRRISTRLRPATSSRLKAAAFQATGSSGSSPTTSRLSGAVRVMTQSTVPKSARVNRLHEACRTPRCGAPAVASWPRGHISGRPLASVTQVPMAASSSRRSPHR